MFMWALLERKGVNEQGGKLAPQVGVAAAAMSNAGVWALHKVSGRSGPCQVTMQLIAHWSAASTAADLPLLLETLHRRVAHGPLACMCATAAYSQTGVPLAGRNPRLQLFGRCWQRARLLAVGLRLDGPCGSARGD